MALRFSAKAVLPTAGNVPHGLGVTPDEYGVVQHGATAVFLVAGSAPDSVNVYVTGGGAGPVVSVFASVVHSIVK